MGIALVVAGGLVLVTAVASLFSYLTEKAKKAHPEIARRMNDIEQRLLVLEERVGAKDEQINQLAHDVSFVNRLIEEKINK